MLAEAVTAGASIRSRVSAALAIGPLRDLEAVRAALDGLRRRFDATAAQEGARLLRVAAAQLRSMIVELRRESGVDDRPDRRAVSPADNRRLAARLLGVLRVAAGPPLATAALLGVSSPTATVAVITLVVAMAAWQAAALRWVLSDRWPSFPTRAAAHVDMTLVGVLVGLSGGSGHPC